MSVLIEEVWGKFILRFFRGDTAIGYPYLRSSICHCYTHSNPHTGITKHSSHIRIHRRPGICIYSGALRGKGTLSHQELQFPLHIVHFQIFAPVFLAKFSEGFFFNLSHPLSCQIKSESNFFQCQGMLSTDSEV